MATLAKTPITGAVKERDLPQNLERRPMDVSSVVVPDTNILEFRLASPRPSSSSHFNAATEQTEFIQPASTTLHSRLESPSQWSASYSILLRLEFRRRQRRGLTVGFALVFFAAWLGVARRHQRSPTGSQPKDMINRRRCSWFLWIPIWRKKLWKCGNLRASVKFPLFTFLFIGIIAALLHCGRLQVRLRNAH